MVPIQFIIRAHTYLLLSFFVASCSYIKPLEVPLETLTFKAASQPADTLLLLLPGKGDRPDSFVKNHWLSILEENNINADIVIADAHLGYYLQDSIPLRIRKDILTAETISHYSQIWIAGISLGGLGALQFSHDYPCIVTGVLLLAPYLGPDRLIDEIYEKKGLDGWQPPRDAKDPFQRLWAWLKKEDPNKPEIFLGYGTNDRFSRAHVLFENEVSVKLTLTDTGSHNWQTWERLWDRLLKSKPLKNLMNSTYKPSKTARKNSECDSQEAEQKLTFIK